MSDQGKAWSVLAMNTLAFTVCFAVWMMNGVLITFFVDNRIYAFDKAEMGWLIGIPVLTGSLLRLPLGILTDRFGGRPVFAATMLFSAAAAWLTSYADGFWGFLLGGLGFGVAGASFAVGIAYTSVWFPKERQGTALGVFGVGNTGAALTSLFAPHVLIWLTGAGASPDGWRSLPRLYAGLLVLTAVVYWLFTYPRVTPHSQGKALGDRLAPLRVVRVWRFGLYYFLVFGGFVALSQWLIPYYVNAYTVSVATAGALAAGFSLPSGLIRAFGGWLSDRWGARAVLYWVFGGATACCLLLAVPRMDVFAPGEGVMAQAAGEVSEASAERIVVGDRTYELTTEPSRHPAGDGRTLIWPHWAFWHEPVVEAGDTVVKRQLLARGVTHVYFQANRHIFTGLVLLLALLMGIGMAAVYKHIPTYFPEEVGVVGGIVGVLGGLGGFFLPIVFGYGLKLTGIWTTCWLLFFALSLCCLVWMHVVVQRLTAGQARPAGPPELAEEMEDLAREMEGIAHRLRRKLARGEA